MVRVQFLARDMLNNINGIRIVVGSISKLGLMRPERRSVMEDNYQNERSPARAMVVIKDSDGEHWLCDKEVDPKKDLEKQGCWQCGDEHFAFTRND